MEPLEDRNAPAEPEEGRMSLIEHLQELRVRLRNSIFVLLGAAFAASFFANDFFQLLARPVRLALNTLKQPATIVKLTPAEGFWVQFKLSLVLGFAVALPLIFWELWKFIAPGLHRREKTLALAMTGATVACFVGGAVFGYTLLSKTTHLFLLGSGVQVPAPGHDGGLVIMNMLTMESVADFQITMLLGCGVAFELPVILGVLGWLGLFSARGMWRFNRYALVLAALGGAILTPGSDAYSQLMLAGPLFLLYNVSIGVVWMIEKRRLQTTALDSPLLLMIAAWPALRRTAGRAGQRAFTGIARSIIPGAHAP
jgi:sec-independent protein translocase protein TatC